MWNAAFWEIAYFSLGCIWGPQEPSLSFSKPIVAVDSRILHVVSPVLTKGYGLTLRSRKGGVPILIFVGKKIEKQPTNKRDPVPHWQTDPSSGGTLPQPQPNKLGVGKLRSEVKVNITLLRRPQSTKVPAQKAETRNGTFEVSISDEGGRPQWRRYRMVSEQFKERLETGRDT